MSLSQHLIPSDDVQIIRATGKSVTDIDLLPPKSVRNCRFLYFSYNSIHDIENIVQFKFVQTILIEYNLLETIESLSPLRNLQNLRTIRLEGNPVCFLPLWDLHLIKMCPTLVSINGIDVKTILKQKKQNYKTDYLETERILIQTIYYAEFVLATIRILKNHPDFTVKSANDLVQMVPEEEFAHSVRSDCKGARPGQYMAFLKKIILDKNGEIQLLTLDIKCIPKSKVAAHQKVLTAASEQSSVSDFMEATMPLCAACLYLVGVGDGVAVANNDNESVSSHRSCCSTSTTRSKAKSVISNVKSINASTPKKMKDRHSIVGLSDDENESQKISCIEFADSDDGKIDSKNKTQISSIDCDLLKSEEEEIDSIDKIEKGKNNKSNEKKPSFLTSEEEEIDAKNNEKNSLKHELSLNTEQDDSEKAINSADQNGRGINENSLNQNSSLINEEENIEFNENKQKQSNKQNSSLISEEEEDDDDEISEFNENKQKQSIKPNSENIHEQSSHLINEDTEEEEIGVAKGKLAVDKKLGKYNELNENDSHSEYDDNHKDLLIKQPNKTQTALVEDQNETELTQTERQQINESQNTQTDDLNESELTQTDRQQISESQNTQTDDMNESQNTQTERQQINESQNTQTDDLNVSHDTQTENLNESQDTQTEQQHINESQNTQTEDLNESELTQTEKQQINESQNTQTDDLNESQSTQTENQNISHDTQTENLNESQDTQTENLNINENQITQTEGKKNVNTENNESNETEKAKVIDGTNTINGSNNDLINENIIDLLKSESGEGSIKQEQNQKNQGLLKVEEEEEEEEDLVILNHDFCDEINQDIQNDEYANCRLNKLNLVEEEEEEEEFKHKESSHNFKEENNMNQRLNDCFEIEEEEEEEEYDPSNHANHLVFERENNQIQGSDQNSKYEDKSDQISSDFSENGEIFSKIEEQGSTPADSTPSNLEIDPSHMNPFQVLTGDVAQLSHQNEKSNNHQKVEQINTEQDQNITSILSNGNVERSINGIDILTSKDVTPINDSFHFSQTSPHKIDNSKRQHKKVFAKDHENLEGSKLSLSHISELSQNNSPSVSSKISNRNDDILNTPSLNLSKTSPDKEEDSNVSSLFSETEQNTYPTHPQVIRGKCSPQPKSILKHGDSKESIQTIKRISFAQQFEDFSSPSVQDGPEFEKIETEENSESYYIAPDYGLVICAFSWWKSQYNERNPHEHTKSEIDPSSVLRDIQTIAASTEIIEKKTQTAQKRNQDPNDLIRALSVKHDLIRRIDIQKDLNASLRARYEQVSREAQSRQTLKSMPVSPAYRKTPVPIEDPLLTNLRFTTTKNSQAKPRDKVNAGGKLTHMDVLRLQFYN